MPNFPRNDLDRPSLVASELGSFWTDLYAGADSVRRYAASAAEQLQQELTKLVESEACLARRKVPVTSVTRWEEFPLSQSARDSRPFDYGDGRLYGEGGLFYGHSASNSTAYPLPDSVVALSQLHDQLAHPTVVLQEGLDYLVDVDRRAIVFRLDPLIDPRFSPEAVVENGVQTDTVLILWGWQVDRDNDLIYDHFGYLVSPKRASSPRYRDAVNALFDCIVDGTTAANVRAVLAAAAAVDVAAGDEEVEVVVADAVGLRVITDANVYTFSPGAGPIIAVGDVLTAGQELVDTIEVNEFNRGVVPADLQAVTLDRGLLDMPSLGAITFPNAYLPLTVETVSGRTRVSVELQGHPLDVEAFWDETHARGIAAGVTLADRLDPRDAPDGDPTADSLPETVNPLILLVGSCLRCNAFMVRIKMAGVGSGAAGLDLLSRLQFLIPPDTAMLSIVEAVPMSVEFSAVPEMEGTWMPAGEPQEVDGIDGTLFALFGGIESRMTQVRGRCL